MIVSEERAVMLVEEGGRKSAEGGAESDFVEVMEHRVRYEEVGDPAMLPAACSNGAR